MAPKLNNIGYRAAQVLRNRGNMQPFTTQPHRVFKGQNLHHNIKRWYQQQGYESSQSVMGTIRKSGNQSLRYLGLAGALGLGGVIAYGLSRPATYVPSDTRSMMANIGGPQFAQMVRGRIMKTFAYLSGSLALTGATAFLLFTRGYGYRVLAANPLVYGIGSMLASMACITLTMGISYDYNPVGKHLAWMLTSGMLGFSLLGLSTIAGGAIIQQAAMITGCIVGGMSLTAMASPSDSFLKMGPYLGVGLGVVIAASLGGMFFPSTTLLMNISLYGGLGLFGLYTAYDTQRVLHDAQVAETFDPISEQMGLYMDTINIFVRVVQILMMQQGGKRR
jgi:FtsH-binding integral membrane protein